MKLPVVWTSRETWSGGYYELAMHVGADDRASLDAGLRALWTAARAHGRVASPRESFESQPEVDIEARPGEAPHPVYGWVVLPSGHRTVCCALRIHDADGGAWLDFCLPTGALSLLDERVGGYPFGPDDGPESLAWRRPIDDWLAAIGREVHRVLPFRVALIGAEVSGRDALVAARAPADRAFGTLLPGPSGVAYLPAAR